MDGRYHKNPFIDAQINQIAREVERRVSVVPPHPMGHAFVWGNVEVKLKNGKPKTFKVCLASVCSADLTLTAKLASSVPGVSGVYYNLD